VEPNANEVVLVDVQKLMREGNAKGVVGSISVGKEDGLFDGPVLSGDGSRMALIRRKQGGGHEVYVCVKDPFSCKSVFSFKYLKGVAISDNGQKLAISGFVPAPAATPGDEPGLGGAIVWYLSLSQSGEAQGEPTVIWTEGVPKKSQAHFVRWVNDSATRFLLSRGPRESDSVEDSNIIEELWREPGTTSVQKYEITRGDSYLSFPVMSQDGKFMVFSKSSPGISSGNYDGPNVFLLNKPRALSIKWTELNVSQNPGARTLGASSQAFVAHARPVASPKTPAEQEPPLFVTFVSEARNLVTPDTNDAADLFVYHLQSGKLIKPLKGLGGREVNGDIRVPVISNDGKTVVFWSEATNLIKGALGGPEGGIYLAKLNWN
jgi:hypothetical protein